MQQRQQGVGREGRLADLRLQHALQQRAKSICDHALTDSYAKGGSIGHSGRIGNSGRHEGRCSEDFDLFARKIVRGRRRSDCCCSLCNPAPSPASPLDNHACSSGFLPAPQHIEIQGWGRWRGEAKRPRSERLNAARNIMLRRREMLRLKKGSITHNYGVASGWGSRRQRRRIVMARAVGQQVLWRGSERAE